MEKRTFAYERFVLTFTRIGLLMTTSDSGIEKHKIEVENLLTKFAVAIEEAKEEKDSNNPPNHFKVTRIDNDLIRFELDESMARIINESMIQSQTQTLILDSYQNAILIVYLWGAYETYFLMLYEDLFKKNPNMLKSNEKISYLDLIDNIEDPLKILIKKELEKIGHLNFEKMLTYLKDKLNIEYDATDVEKLKEIYLIRNIVAHNTGIVNSDFTLVPENITLNENEIIVSRKYVENSILIIFNVIKKVESAVDEKFYNSAKS